MSKETVTGKVTKIIRHGHTVYGNPIISIVIEGKNVNEYGIGTFRISDNASMVYGISNPEYRDEDHEFWLTKAGRVQFARRTV